MDEVYKTYFTIYMRKEGGSGIRQSEAAQRLQTLLP